jgi:hypothetical protein
MFLLASQILCFTWNRSISSIRKSRWYDSSSWTAIVFNWNTAYFIYQLSLPCAWHESQLRHLTVGDCLLPVLLTKNFYEDAGLLLTFLPKWCINFYRKRRKFIYFPPRNGRIKKWTALTNATPLLRVGKNLGFRKILSWNSCILHLPS